MDIASVALISLFGSVVALAILQVKSLRTPYAGLLRYLPVLLIVLLVCVYLILRATGTFSVQKSFGAREDLSVLATIVIATVAGIIASKAFEVQDSGKLRWQEIVVPLLVTPLAVSPVWSVYVDQNLSNPTVKQFISFAFMAFSNGFTWKSIVAKLGKADG